MAALVVLFFTLLFGIIGFRFAAGLLILYFVPFYLLLSSASLENSEKMVFGLFLSFVFIPSIAYWVGFVVPFRLAIGMAFILVLALALFLRYRKRAVSKQQPASPL